MDDLAISWGNHKCVWLCKFENIYQLIACIMADYGYWLWVLRLVSLSVLDTDSEYYGYWLWALWVLTLSITACESKRSGYWLWAGGRSPELISKGIPRETRCCWGSCAVVAVPQTPSHTGDTKSPHLIHTTLISIIETNLNTWSKKLHKL